jgi:hypothetical protein
MVVKIVIWLNLKVASVCTFQIWNFFGSRVFYMFWGIQRLQICRNWMYRTKVMIYLVQIGNYCHLKFISKTYTVTLWYYYLIGFYTLQGFQGYKVCKKWTCRLFSMEFTNHLWNRDLNLKFENEFWLGWLELTWLATWQHGTGWYRFG